MGNIYFFRIVTKQEISRTHQSTERMKKETQDRKTLTDEELMTMYQASDYLAFEALYQRHAGRIFGYLSQKVNSETAQELLQDAFSRLHKSREKYNSQYPFLPWIFTIVRNLLRDYYKKAETQTILQSIDINTTPPTAERDMTLDQLQGIENILADLPQNQQRALRLRYQQNWTFEKIAQELETSPQNIRQLISRGLKKIRTSFAKDTGE